jgi:phage terminase small subunit
MTERRPRRKAPQHLAAATRRWVEQLEESYEFEEHHWRLAVAAGECWDRAASARKVLDEHGVSYTDRFGAPRLRPEAGVERDMKTLFARLVRELGLDVEPPAESRLPRMGGR